MNKAAAHATQTPITKRSHIFGSTFADPRLRVFFFFFSAACFVRRLRFYNRNFYITTKSSQSFEKRKKKKENLKQIHTNKQLTTANCIIVKIHTFSSLEKKKVSANLISASLFFYPSLSLCYCYHYQPHQQKNGAQTWSFSSRYRWSLWNW